MAAYISVPRDFSKVKSKVAFNLTKRQLICFGAAALVGVPLFFVLRDVGGNTAATLGMMIVMLPAFFLGMYQKNGQPAEKLLRYYVQAKFLRGHGSLFQFFRAPDNNGKRNAGFLQQFTPPGRLGGQDDGGNHGRKKRS